MEAISKWKDIHYLMPFEWFKMTMDFSSSSMMPLLPDYHLNWVIMQQPMVLVISYRSLLLRIVRTDGRLLQPTWPEPISNFLHQYYHMPRLVTTLKAKEYCHQIIKYLLLLQKVTVHIHTTSGHGIWIFMITINTWEIIWFQSHFNFLGGRSPSSKVFLVLLLYIIYFSDFSVPNKNTLKPDL